MAAALLLGVAGCGGGAEPAVEERAPLPRTLAEELAARSEQVAARLDEGDSCAAREEALALREQAVAAMNDGRVPGPYQEELLAAANALAGGIECVPPAPPVVSEDDEDDDDVDEDDGKKERKGKKPKKDKPGKGHGRDAAPVPTAATTAAAAG